MIQHSSDTGIPGTPLVSVAMCTYNGAAYFKEQIDSIINQSYKNLEIVIVDDFSSDDTLKIIKECQQKDPRIKVYQNEKNLGFNRNFEKASRHTSGDYIAISDQDDIWEREKIETMMICWPADSLFIYSLSGSFYNDDFKSRKPAPRVYYTDIDNIHSLVFNSPVHGHACMFKKELLNHCTPFPADIFYDWWMSMHAASIGVIGSVPQTLTWHRVHEKNSSRELTSIGDKKERNKQLRQQSVYFIETFCRKGIAKEKEKKSLLEYASLLKIMDGKKFSWGMFRYVMKNRKLVFHYKKETFSFLSYLKHAFLMARKGLL
jgi:glycosyltransferase involved in cell wall biosynthesis